MSVGSGINCTTKKDQRLVNNPKISFVNTIIGEIWLKSLKCIHSVGHNCSGTIVCYTEKNTKSIQDTKIERKDPDLDSNTSYCRSHH